MGKRAKGSRRPFRLLVYSHDSGGMGHYSRLLKLSASLREELPEVSILIITGSFAAHLFDVPNGVDLVKLPCVSRQTQDTGRAANKIFTAKYLPLMFKEVKLIRERIILSATLGYRPHIFLIEYYPLGMQGELLPTLSALMENRRRTQMVLGLRDIWDDPQTVPFLRSRAAADALEKIYDAIWVYGCQTLFDPITEYRLTDAVAEKVSFCGYLSPAPPSTPSGKIRRELGVGAGKVVLVTVGAGEHGFPLLDTYLKALEFLPKRAEVFSLLVSGPGMSPQERETLRRRCENLPSRRRVELREFSPRVIEYISAADTVVSMGGYNTLMEIISLRKEAVVVPLTSPLLEQWLRAEAFEKRGLIRTVHPGQLSPKTLAEAIRNAWEAPAVPFAQRLEASGLDLNGFEAVKDNLLGLLNSRT